MRDADIACPIHFAVVALEVFVDIDIHVAVGAMEHRKQALPDID